MAESPAKRRKLSDDDDAANDQGGVTLELPLCARPVFALISPETTPDATSEDGKQAQVTADHEPSSQQQAPLLPLVTESRDYLSPERTCPQHPKGKTSALAAPCRHCAILVDELSSYGSSCDVEFRMESPNGRRTLKRWLLNRNFNLDGEATDRSVEMPRILRSSRITSMDVRVAIVFGCQQVRIAHESIYGLQNYLARRPYVHTYTGNNPAPEADDVRSFPTTGETMTMSDGSLDRWLLKLACEIDYLRMIEEEMEQQILHEKWWEAKNGNVYEITELLRLGFVDKAMVGEFCGLPDV